MFGPLKEVWQASQYEWSTRPARCRSRLPLALSTGLQARGRRVLAEWEAGALRTFQRLAEVWWEKDKAKQSETPSSLPGRTPRTRARPVSEFHFDVPWPASSKRGGPVPFAPFVVYVLEEVPTVYLSEYGVEDVSHGINGPWQCLAVPCPNGLWAKLRFEYTFRSQWSDTTGLSDVELTDSDYN